MTPSSRWPVTVAIAVDQQSTIMSKLNRQAFLQTGEFLMKSFEAFFLRASFSILLLLEAASIRAVAQSGAVPAAPPAEISNANVIVARGLLHRNGLAGTL